MCIQAAEMLCNITYGKVALSYYTANAEISYNITLVVSLQLYAVEC